MIIDPVFFVAAIPAVLIAGISKGGFGGGVGFVAVPTMALVIEPRIAAAIMLPILCVADLISVGAFWRRADWRNLRIMLAGAAVGIGVGTATFHYLNADAIRLMIGVIAVAFCLHRWFFRAHREGPAAAARPGKGGFWSGVAGFTSFVSHSGGPPVAVYLLPQRLEKSTFQATTAVFFMAVNYVKLVPYALLGQLSPTNLTTSVVLFPVAVAGALLGVWLHHRTDEALFNKLIYIFVFLTGLKLLYDGIAGLS